MSIISFRDVTIGFGGHPLLNQVNFQIKRGERVCLMGRNGAGKSTLMRLMAGDLQPDSGDIVRMKELRAVMLPQEVPQQLQGKSLDIVLESWKPVDKKVDSIPLQKRHVAEKNLSRMNLDPEARFETLSAGLKRRVLLARCLTHDPDILLLDEPTNHLDIDAISWMEDFMLKYGGTLLFVTHDRMFLKKIATRIFELDRGSLCDWTCDYEKYLIRRQALQDAECDEWKRFDKKMSREEIWIRQGVKARRTRNEGRVRVLEKMREERQNRHKRQGSVRLQIQDAERSGKKVIEAEQVFFGYDDQKPIIADFSTLIMRGDKVGIIGSNGSGKTTLLRLLLGENYPTKGLLRQGVRFEVAYFDQLRMQLDENRTVAENVCDGGDTIIFNGKSRHIISYLQDFLFSPERTQSPGRILSGGERNRLLLAKLFTQPSNVLIMDEPTNDLDTETLELLEEMLFEYEGTLLLVSHDRTFLNQVVTSTLVFEGNGKIGEYVGGYDDWLRQRNISETVIKPEKAVSKREMEPQRSRRRQALSFKEQHELNGLPQKIEALEAEQKQWILKMSDPKFYQYPGTEVAKGKTRLEELDREIEEACNRWEYLETAYTKLSAQEDSAITSTEPH